MNQDLATMQKHLDLTRLENERLTAELEDTLNESLTMVKLWKSTRRKYRIAVAVLSVIALWIGYANMRYAADVRWSANKLAENKDLQQRFDNVLNMLHVVNKRVLELEDANEQLITHCRPCDVNRAIKDTPLPPMVKDMK